MEIKRGMYIKQSSLIFELPESGEIGGKIVKADSKEKISIKENLLRSKPVNLPELSELDVIRHYTNLSKLNFSVDSNFYPLGSCTMKYNPKVLEKCPEEFSELHPMIACLPGGESIAQGALGIIYETEQLISEITGMDGVTTFPMAGAHGELTGIFIISAYHASKGNKKKNVIVPDSSHGTNPASAATAGYEVITIPSLSNGEMDLEAFKKAISEETAAVMMTCPNTLGIFETKIKEISNIAHSVDALMYYDGANLNAIMGRVRPGDIGFDVVHVNVHKTFGTPHGGGGPGAGPVGVKKKLVPFLPVPRIVKDKDGKYSLLDDVPQSIGRICGFFGNFGVVVKAFAYMLLLGKDGILKASEQAVLSANYLKEKLKAYYDLPCDRPCMHEFVLSAERQLKNGIHAIDIAKALIDRGFHPPTVYFPLIVKEAIMIEPTETESKKTLDEFIRAMVEIAELSEKDTEILKRSPLLTPIGRLDEAKAAREARVSFE